MMSPAEIGRSVRALRDAKGLTQQALATAAGVTVNTISKLESAAPNPELITLVSVGRVLGAEVLFVKQPRKRGHR